MTLLCIRCNEKSGFKDVPEHLWLCFKHDGKDITDYELQKIKQSTYEFEKFSFIKTIEDNA